MNSREQILTLLILVLSFSNFAFIYFYKMELRKEVDSYKEQMIIYVEKNTPNLQDGTFVDDANTEEVVEVVSDDENIDQGSTDF